MKIDSFSNFLSACSNYVRKTVVSIRRFRALISYCLSSIFNRLNHYSRQNLHNLNTTGLILKAISVWTICPQDKSLRSASKYLVAHIYRFCSWQINKIPPFLLHLEFRNLCMLSTRYGNGREALWYDENAHMNPNIPELRMNSSCTGTEPALYAGFAIATLCRHASQACNQYDLKDILVVSVPRSVCDCLCGCMYQLSNPYCGIMLEFHRPFVGNIAQASVHLDAYVRWALWRGLFVINHLRNDIVVRRRPQYKRKRLLVCVCVW